jgi:hypothetical protein
MLNNNQFCYFCFIDEIGLCNQCINSIAIDVCLNCITYGNNNNQCINCELLGDEAVSLGNDVSEIRNWIFRNDQHFLSIINKNDTQFLQIN